MGMLRVWQNSTSSTDDPLPLDQMSYQMLDPHFAGPIPWYDPNNQFQEPAFGLPFDLGVATMPLVPQVETDD